MLKKYMHISENELSTRLTKAKQKVKVGARYYHYKNVSRPYTVLGLAITEENEEICVIYQANYGKKLTFTRPLSSWLDKVEVNGSKVNRFTLI